MERFKKFALLALAIGAIGVVGAPGASAHAGTANLTCTSATFNYSGFSSGSHQVQETIYIDGYNTLKQVNFTFSGTSGSDTVPITVPNGSHSLVADAWNLPSGGQVVGFETAPTTVNCGPPPCPSGKISMRWHYKYLGTSGSWSATKSTDCPGTITFAQQGMEGDLKVTPGERVDVGYSFKAPNGPITVSNAKLVFVIRCVGGGTPSQSSWTVNLPTRTYNVTNGDWQPTGDQHSSLVYQGGANMPNFCSGGRVRLDKGGVFSASFS